MSTSRSLRVSEVFASIQGEGASAGAPCVFLRLATCNLRCGYCDTKYTWDWDAYRYEDEVRHRGVPEVVGDVLARAPERVVVTGGEPLLQQPALAAFLAALPDHVVVEIETNGTLTPSAELRERVNQWNVSPKLANSGETHERRISSGALVALRDTGRAWLKLVIASDSDAAEAAELRDALAWPAERVLFMPMAATTDELAERSPRVVELSRLHGARVSPRLHVERWGGRRGV